MTLYRCRCELGLSSMFSQISDEDLITKISSIKSILPECGERLVIGKLQAEGMVVPKKRTIIYSFN